MRSKYYWAKFRWQDKRCNCLWGWSFGFFLLWVFVISTLQWCWCQLYLSCQVTCVGSYSADWSSFPQDSTGAKLATLTASPVTWGCRHFLFLLREYFWALPHSASDLLTHLVSLVSVLLISTQISPLYVAFLDGCWFGCFAWLFDWWDPKALVFLSLCSATSHPSSKLLITVTHAGLDPLPQSPPCWEQREVRLYH